MKKGMALFLIFFFLGCQKNVLNKDIVSKYEYHLNKQIQKVLEELPQNAQISIELSPFSCRSEESFIRCISTDFNFFTRDDGAKKKLFKIGKLELYSNQVYTGKSEAFISFEDYYENLFSNNKNLKTSFSLQEFEFSQELIDSINANLSQSDPKILSYINKLNSSTYTISLENLAFKKNDAYNNIFNIKIHNEKLNLNISLDFDYKHYLLDFLEKKGIQFNANTYTIGGVDEFLNEDATQLIQALGDNIIFNTFKITSSLDTEGVFENYIAIAKTLLQAFIIQSENEEQASLLNKASLVLNESTKDTVYSFDLEILFKNITLDQYSKEHINVVEKLSIHDQDFTQGLRILFDFIMMFMIFDSIAKF